jgi:hypothetical protein
MGALIDLTNMRFGRLLVLRRVENNRRGKVCWLCRCDCGKEKEVRAQHLRSVQQSCGCQRGGKLKHGHVVYINGKQHPSPTYHSWMAMKQRCLNPNQLGYPDYGGRGITVCDRWQGEHGFENFLADMGKRPKGKTLDRFPNNDGNYEPGNCRWATPKQQANNRHQANRYTKRRAA